MRLSLPVILVLSACATTHVGSDAATDLGVTDTHAVDTGPATESGVDSSAPREVGVDTSLPADGGVIDGRIDDAGMAESAVDARDASPPRCVRHADCALRPRSCCGRCGEPTRDDVVAVLRSELFPNPACTDVTACPECAGFPDPNLLAECSFGECRVVDVRTDRVSECAVAGDCTLGFTNECCRCDEILSRELVAYSIARSGRIHELVCGESGGAICPPCIASWPAGWSASCEPDSSGVRRCVVTD